MGIRWYRWSTGVEPTAASENLATAAADADAGGSLYNLASALVRLAAHRANVDEALHVLSALSPRDWLRLDVEVRRFHHYRNDDAWPRIADPVRTASDPLSVLLTACAGDGRLRQRAVQSPLMRSDQRLLPVLLIRTGDWAKQVRDDAEQVLPAALDSADADGLLRATGIAVAMRDWQRGQSAITAVTEALRRRSDGALNAARTSDDVQVRRLAYRVWLESGRADSDAIVAAAMTECDIICQRLIVDALARNWQHDELERLLTARFAPVRAAAVAGLVQIGHPEAGGAALADRSAKVRAVAQWAMQVAGRDAAEPYRAMLVSGDDSSTRTAIAGLGECGTVDDAESVARYLSHDRPRVRAEVIRAVRRLGGTLSRIAGMLTDPAPVVVRAVVDATLGQPRLVTNDRLWDLLAADQPAHVRRAAFRLLIARDRWTRIEADLRLVADPDELLAGNARTNLIGWLHHDASPGSQMPSQSTRERLGGLIDGAEADIGARNAHLLRWHLGLSP
jgi:hypothetical protein